MSATPRIFELFLEILDVGENKVEVVHHVCDVACEMFGYSHF